MKRFIMFFLLTAASTGLLYGQGAIKGNIRTRLVQSGEEIIAPLISAEVYVMYAGTKIKTTTNDHGDYTIRPLEPGTYNVTICSYSIDTVTIPDIKVTGSGIAFVQDLVVSLGRQMSTLVITSSTSLRNESPSKSELKGVDFERLPEPGNLNKAIELMGGGTWVSDNGRQISFRGARIGDALYIIDGVRQRGTDVSLPNRSIAIINSWNGGVPAEYGDFMGGVVVIETMSYFEWENQQEVKRLIRKKIEEQERLKMELELKEMKESMDS